MEPKRWIVAYVSVYIRYTTNTVALWIALCTAQKCLSMFKEIPLNIVISWASKWRLSFRTDIRSKTWDKVTRIRRYILLVCIKAPRKWKHNFVWDIISVHLAKIRVFLTEVRFQFHFLWAIIADSPAGLIKWTFSREGLLDIYSLLFVLIRGGFYSFLTSWVESDCTPCAVWRYNDGYLQLVS